MAAAAAAAVKRRQEVEAAIAEGNIPAIGTRIESFAQKEALQHSERACRRCSLHGCTASCLATMLCASAKDPLPPADQTGIWRHQRKACYVLHFTSRLLTFSTILVAVSVLGEQVEAMCHCRESAGCLQERGFVRYGQVATAYLDIKSQMAVAVLICGNFMINIAEPPGSN